MEMIGGRLGIVTPYPWQLMCATILTRWPIGGSKELYDYSSACVYIQGTDGTLYVYRHLGLTPPLSTAGPTPNDELLSKSLEEALIPHGVFESEAELNHR